MTSTTFMPQRAAISFDQARLKALSKLQIGWGISRSILRLREGWQVNKNTRVVYHRLHSQKKVDAEAVNDNRQHMKNSFYILISFLLQNF